MSSVGPDFSVKRENDEWVYQMRVNGKVVCTAKTLDSILLTISTHHEERRKGYATTLLRHIEDKARQSGAKRFQTSDIDSTVEEAVRFFKKNGYTLTPIVGDEEFLEGTKGL